MENLGNWAGTTDTSITNRIQEMAERSSGWEDRIEEIDTSVKENVKSKTFLTQNVQEIWETMNRSDLQIMCIEEWEETQLRNVFDKTTEEKLSHPKKEIHVNV